MFRYHQYIYPSDKNRMMTGRNGVVNSPSFGISVMGNTKINFYREIRENI